MTTPRQHALRYRIWAYASPIGWNCTNEEIAEATGLAAKTVANTVRFAGWGHRVRSAQRGEGPSKTAGFLSSFDGPQRVQRGDGVLGI